MTATGPGEGGDDLGGGFGDGAALGQAVTTPAGAPLRVNAALAAMLGYPVAELATRPLRSLAHPDDLAAHLEAEQALRGGDRDLVALETRYLTGDGGYLAVHVTTQVRRAPDGRPRDHVAYVLARPARAAAASEHRYRRLFEAARDGILILDAATGLVLDANPFMTELTGLARAELLHRSLRDLGPFQTAAQSSFEELRARDGVRHDELQLATRDGRLVDVEVISTTYDRDDRRVIQCHVRDIDARRRMEHERERLAAAVAEASRATRASEAHYRRLVQALPGVLYALPDGAGDAYYSPQVEAALGYPAAELARDPAAWLAAIHPDDQPRVVHARADRSPDRIEIEYRIRHANGQWRWFLDRAAWIARPDGTTALEGLALDISDHKHAEAVLRTMVRAVEQSPVSIVITDREGNIEYVNPRFEQVSGYARAEAVGQNPRILQSGTTPREVYADLWRVIAAGGEWHGELCNRRKDGALFWESAAISGLTDEDGQVAHFIAVKEDITERKHAEEALRASERTLREAQVIARLGDYALDVATGTWRSSATLDTIFGIDEAYERSIAGWTALLHPDDRAATQQHLLDDVLALGHGFDREYRIVRQHDQAVRWVHGLGTVLRAADGQPVAMHGTIQDITTRKEAERERADLEARFQQAQRMESVGRLAGGVAHDFNNLLSVISSYAEMICEDLAPGQPFRADVDEIRAAAQRATDLTRQLLAFSRRQVLAPRVLDLNETVAGMEKLLARLLGADIVVTLHAARDLGHVRADPTQMEQIVMNLAINARDAMPHGGTLTIATANAEVDDARAHPDLRPGPYVALIVSDSGTGMDAATQGQIFEPFFTTKAEGKGTGLGLATVFGIVAQSGGHIAVTSAPGQGTTFTIHLPRVHDATTAPAPRVAPAATRGRATILLVEDQDQVRLLAATILRRQGYVVLDAANAGEALLVCEQHPAPIDLLVTDVVLPRLSGRQLAERLASLRPAMKVLYMSGSTDDTRLGDPAVPFLQKPLTPASLTTKVAAVLRDP